MLTRHRLVDAMLRSDVARATAVALCDHDDDVTYAELERRVVRRGDELALDTASLVVLTGDRSIEYVVTYLALLDRGHVPLLAGAHAHGLAQQWDAAAVIDARRERLDINRRRHRAADVHPDLALLMSTSGSTGSPKLVRLSHANLSANASAIAQYLDLGPHDCGITALPLHYCYGLSVLHSHLIAGSAVAMYEASVVDPCFRDAMQRHRVTNVAGVAHSFDLLERAGPDRLFVPSLRFVTQAGGRLDPDAVRRWTNRSETSGVDFYVMYGQTEATARMAYLRPEDAARNPRAIGRAIPGGSLSLRPVDGCVGDVGELVYTGPNVMLGYAEQPADLAVGRVIDELVTGDLARYDATNDVFEIVGRRSRFVKPFGVRVDLDALESSVREWLGEHVDVAVGGTDDRLVIVASGAEPAGLASFVRELTGLPASAVTVGGGPVPRTSSGKVDYHTMSMPPLPAVANERRASASDVVARMFDLAAVPANATFVSLGGDSLSYIECSIHLERVIGRLPLDWHLMPVADLDRLIDQRRHRLARLDTTVALRAIAICAVVCTHMRLKFVPGGAHLLLAVAGFNLARFMLPIEATRDRAAAGLRSVARVAVPTVGWVAATWMLGASYGIGTLVLVNNYTGPAGHRGDHWHFWFIEAFVQLVLVLTALLSIPAVRRIEQRLPYVFPLTLFAVTLVLRMEWAWMGDWYNIRYRPHTIAWFFVLGWLIHRSTTTPKRMLTSVLCVVSIAGFFHYPPREWFIGASLVLLVWIREIPVPRLMVRPVAVIGSASMWILITHFVTWPPLVDRLPLLVAYPATLAIGVVVWFVVDRPMTSWKSLRARFATAALRRGSEPSLVHAG